MSEAEKTPVAAELPSESGESPSTAPAKPRPMTTSMNGAIVVQSGEVIDLKFNATYEDRAGTQHLNPYAQFRENEDGERELIGGYETYSLGPESEPPYSHIRLNVGQRVTLPKKGGPWLANRLADNPFIELRIRPDTAEIKQLNHPRIKRLTDEEWAKAQAEDAAPPERFLPPPPDKRRGRRP